MSYTYSFLDVVSAITGPGGSFGLGSGSGVAKEGITIEFLAEADHMDIGADGLGMHSLIADRSAKITVRLLKNSSQNQALSLMYNLQKTSGATWGQNTITVGNVASGDNFTAEEVAFVKMPNINYAAEGGLVEWEFNATRCNGTLGSGV